MLLVSARQLRKRSVYDREGDFLGRVEGCCVDTEKGTLTSLLVSLKLPFRLTSLSLEIPMLAVAHTTPGVRLLGTLPQLGIHYQRRHKKIVHYIGYRVLTKSGIYLGKVYDFLFDPAALQVVQFEIVPRLFFLQKTQSLLFSWNDVLDVQKETLIVRDSLVKEGLLDTGFLWRRKKQTHFAYTCSMHQP